MSEFKLTPSRSARRSVASYTTAWDTIGDRILVPPVEPLTVAQ
jgi:hypothetical protein